VEPDERLWPASPSAKLFCQEAQPGEDGADVLRRLGRKEGWFSVKMLHPGQPSQTLTKQDRGCGSFFHWNRRHLSIREALVLTGFPPTYILPGAFSDRWARIGNSVAPPMSREIVRQVIGSIHV